MTFFFTGTHTPEVFLRQAGGGADLARRHALALLDGRLVVSVQADPGSPLRHVSHITAIARCVLMGGSAGLRIEGLDSVAAVRAITDVPLIGLVKQAQPGSGVYITPTAALARAVAARGADIVAVDATLRRRPEPFADIARAVHDAGAEVLADISTVEEAQAALGAGADAVATTLSGYTDAAPSNDGPDMALMRGLARAGIPFVAEGRIRSPAEAQACAALGARFVIVGSAITRPDVITQWFAASIATVAAAGRPSARA